jgi:TRAP-type uncharacterized transport system fused permease subunit
VAAHLVVFYAACLSNITPPVCVSAFAAAALAKADPMETGFAALKFGFALIFLPFGFVYFPALLLNGSVLEVIHTVFMLLLGFMAFSMVLQGADFLRAGLSWSKRGLYLVASLLLLLPVPLYLNLVGVGVLVLVWVPGLITYRKELSARS